MKVVCVGDNCVDYYVLNQELFFGGNPVNVSVYLRRNGIESAYIGYMGNDDFGKKFYKTLANYQIDVSHVTIKDGQTAMTKVEIINNERILGDYDEGVFVDFKLNQDDLTYINTFDLMVTGIWSRTNEYLKDIHIPIAYDFADKWDDEFFISCMPYITYAFYSDDYHDKDYIKNYMKTYFHPHLKVMVCTCGERGSIAYDGTCFYEYGIFQCDIVDTMGAGDSYIAGFLINYDCYHDILKAMENGAKESSKTISYQGAW